MTSTLPGLRDAFAQLVAAPSVSCMDTAWDQSNKPVIEILAGWFESLGFRVECLPVDESRGKWNMIAARGSGDNGLVLAGHTDTVPYDDKQWDSDPFRLTERDGRFYGLGTADMKGFFPLVLEVLRVLDLARLESPLLILATCDEECTMAGAKALADSHRGLGLHAVIGEPTGLRPIRTHKGVLLETIRIVGRAGHSSDPAFGHNALEGMHAVMGVLLEWREKVLSLAHDDAFKVTVPTLNFGTIRGGDSPNRICGECELQLDMRLLPNMNVDTVRRELQTRARDALTGSGLQVEFGRHCHGVAGMVTAQEAEIVRVSEALTGQQAGGVAFATEGPYLNRMGMETVVLGPGDIDQAHQANEFLLLERIEPMQNILTGIIGHFCLNGGGNG